MNDRLFFILCISWLAIVIGGSLLFRLNRGKPIFARARDDALVTERWVSGGAGLGAANNCLLASVSPSGILVMPQFPMTLLFLPEIYRLEFELAPAEIKRVIMRKRWFGTRVLIERADGRRTFKLKLRNPDAFMAAIERIGILAERD